MLRCTTLSLLRYLKFVDLGFGSKFKNYRIFNAFQKTDLSKYEDYPAGT